MTFLCSNYRFSTAWHFPDLCLWTQWHWCCYATHCGTRALNGHCQLFFFCMCASKQQWPIPGWLCYWLEHLSHGRLDQLQKYISGVSQIRHAEEWLYKLSWVFFSWRFSVCMHSCDTKMKPSRHLGWCVSCRIVSCNNYNNPPITRWILEQRSYALNSSTSTMHSTHTVLPARTSPRLTRFASGVVEPGPPDEKLATRTKRYVWTRFENKALMECCYSSCRSEQIYMQR